MDQHKKRANKYYTKHIEQQSKVRKSVFGKRESLDEEKCSGNEREMQRVSRCYLLPTALEPLQCFERPRPKIQKAEEQISKEPQIKKRKLMKMDGANKRMIPSPKPPLKLCPNMAKIGVKKEVKMKKDVRINKLMKKEKKSAIIQSKKKLVQHSHLLKSAMIKVKTSKHCKDAKEQKKEEKKTKKRKHSDFKSPKANNAKIKKRKNYKNAKKEKKEKNVERLFVFV